MKNKVRHVPPLAAVFRIPDTITCQKDTKNPLTFG